MVVYGGVNLEAQVLQLENRPPHVLIGTPGRTLDLLKRKKIKLDKLRFFVIDECDKVLEEYGGFIRYASDRPEYLHGDQLRQTGYDVYSHPQREDGGTCREVHEGGCLNRVGN